MNEQEPSGALSGVRVVECCQGVGGPMLAMLLAEQGADVIKVEPPQGDRLRGAPAFHVLNRSKRSLVLDLAAPDGRSRLIELLRDADVLLYDGAIGPGAAGWEVLESEARALNPRLVIGFLPAYGSTGPHAGLPPEEALVQAIAGASAAQWRYDPRPAFINIPISGYAQGIVGAGAVAAALYARAQSGRGSRFELSAVAALFQFETTAYIKSANIMRMAGQSSPLGPLPTYRLFRASDGWLFVGALTAAFWTKLALAVGLDDALADPRFAAAPMGMANMDDRRELAQRFEAAFATRTCNEWMHVLEEADVPRSLVLTREQWASDPQIEHNGMIVEVDDPVLGKTRQMGVPVRLGASPGRVKCAAPVLGEHDGLPANPWPGARELSPRTDEDGNPARRYPLDGIRVLDLGTFIAGASCSMMLADLGADVIKVEGPEGDAWRYSGLGFLGANRNKRGLCIDLRKPEGRDLFLELAAGSDVVLDNLRPGIMDRLGIGYEALRASNPRIVHCSVTAYGPTGPRAHLPGFDPLMQAQGGIMWAQGNLDDEPVYLQIAVCDYATALTAAYGIIAALVARGRTGAGDRVETCLANASLTVQAGECIFYDGKPAESRGGRDLAGRNAFSRIYGTSDGAVTVACTSADHVDALAGVLGVEMPWTPGEGIPGPAAAAKDHPLAIQGAAALALERAFSDRPTRECIDALRARGVPVAPCVAVADLFDDEHLRANGLWWDMEDPRWGAVRQTGALIKWDDMSMALIRRAPQLGEHSREVLREFGVTDERLSALEEARVIAGVR